MESPMISMVCAAVSTGTGSGLQLWIMDTVSFSNTGADWTSSVCAFPKIACESPDDFSSCLPMLMLSKLEAAVKIMKEEVRIPQRPA